MQENAHTSSRGLENPNRTSPTRLQCPLLCALHFSFKPSPPHFPHSTSLCSTFDSRDHYTPHTCLFHSTALRNCASSGPSILCRRPSVRTGTRMASLTAPSRPQGRMRRRHDQVRARQTEGALACDSGHVLHEVKTRGSKSGDSRHDGSTATRT